MSGGALQSSVSIVTKRDGRGERGGVKIGQISVTKYVDDPEVLAQTLSDTSGQKLNIRML